MKPKALSAILFGLALAALPCCMSLNASRNTFALSSAPAHVNGADIRMKVKPEGTENGSFSFSAMVVNAAVATFDGPFRWRLEATGSTGGPQSLVVHRIHTRTTRTKRDEWYPLSHLGKRADFKPIMDLHGKSRALYEIPGLLVVKPKDDGALEITVDLTVTASGRSERKLVRFRMEPAQNRQDEFIFLPVEIANGIGKPMSEWEESGWD